jgi:hypothetical protein
MVREQPRGSIDVTFRGIPLLNTSNSHRSSFCSNTHPNSKNAIQLHAQPPQPFDPIARTDHSAFGPKQPVQRIHQRLTSARAVDKSLVLCCLLLLRPGATLPRASPRVGQPRSVLYRRFRGRRSGFLLRAGVNWLQHSNNFLATVALYVGAARPFEQPRSGTAGDTR